MNKKPNKSAWTWFIGRLRTHFLAGLLVVVPIAASILILVWVFRTIDDILQPFIKNIFGHPIVEKGQRAELNQVSRTSCSCFTAELPQDGH